MEEDAAAAELFGAENVTAAAAGADVPVDPSDGGGAPVPTAIPAPLACTASVDEARVDMRVKIGSRSERSASEERVEGQVEN